MKKNFIFSQLTLILMKKSFLTICILIALLLQGCGSYSRIRFSTVEFFEQEKTKENALKYDFYVHDGAESYLIKSPRITPDSIIGGFEAVSNANLPQENLQKKRVPESLKNDVHIYLKDSVELENSGSSANGISKDQIANVEMYAKEKAGLTGLYVTLIIVGLSLLTILVVGIVAKATATAAGQSSDQSSDGSTQGSNGSSDGSQGSSDGSQGSSDGSSTSSDGSGSSSDGSGCYIATMAYGSYDAPEVLILRKFRDEWLDKTTFGRKFIQWYYRNSPGFVERHQSKRWLHRIVRFALNIFTTILKPFVSA